MLPEAPARAWLQCQIHASPLISPMAATAGLRHHPSLPSLRPTQGFTAGTRVVGKAVADALPFGMQYCLWKLREPAINENSCGRRSRLNSRGFARRPKKTHARRGHIGGLKLRSDDGGRREPSGY